jgi:hypothetical protein
MARSMGSKEGGKRLPERTDALICNTDEGEAAEGA